MPTEDHPSGAGERQFVFADHRGYVYRVIEEMELEAVKAVAGELWRRYGGMVTAGLSSPRLLGSGTVIRIGDELFSATARHLFDDHGFDNEVLVSWGDGDGKHGVVGLPTGKEHAAHDARAVAIRRLRRKSSGEIGGFCLDQVARLSRTAA
jgi:hypothetical protein